MVQLPLWLVKDTPVVVQVPVPPLAVIAPDPLIAVTFTLYGFGLWIFTTTVPSPPGYRSPTVDAETSIVDSAVAVPALAYPAPVPLAVHAAYATPAPETATTAEPTTRARLTDLRIRKEPFQEGHT